MCGRFTLTIPDHESLALALGVAPDPSSAELYRPRYNVAPTDAHWILRVKEGRRELLPAKWGLVNSWAKDASGAARQINARIETARSRPAFRGAFERRRCVVPADGFFEWAGEKKARRPIWYHPRDGLMLLAGLYESWRDPRSGTWQRTFSIVTTPANDLVAPVHDRMPAILTSEDVEAWLEPVEEGDTEALVALQRRLRPAPPDALVATAVSPRVNSVKNDDPECLTPEPGGLPLFAK